MSCSSYYSAVLELLILLFSCSHILQGWWLEKKERVWCILPPCLNMNIFILFKVELDGLVVEKDCQCILDLLHIVQVPHAGFLEFKQNFFKQFIYKIFFFLWIWNYDFGTNDKKRILSVLFLDFFEVFASRTFNEPMFSICPFYVGFWILNHF